MKDNKIVLTNNELMNDKKDLFEKLQKITELFGINVIVSENKNRDNCSAIYEKSSILIGFKDVLKDEKINELIIENIDKFHNSKHEQLYKECPSLIKYFLHEVGHIMTENSLDTGDYRRAVGYLKDRFDSARSIEEQDALQKEYRTIPLEKIADTLSSELLYYNYDAIMKILLEKRVRVTQKRIASNKAIAYEIREKYIK